MKEMRIIWKVLVGQSVENEPAAMMIMKVWVL